MAQEPGDLSELESDLPSLAEPSTLRGMLWRKGGRALQIASNFLLGQGAVQAIGALGGLLLVRFLSVESYAQLGLVLGFQSAVSVLMDLGFAGTIIPLVGERRDDRSLVGRYVLAAKRLRDRSFFIVAPGAAVAFLAITHKHQWGWHVQGLLLGSVLLALYSGGPMSYYSAPLILYGKLRDYYLPQVVSSLLRLSAFVVLFFAGGLTAWTVSWLTAFAITLNARFYRILGSRHMVFSRVPEPALEREIVRYILPATPMMLVAAFQGQISLLLISIFGGTMQIAQVAALNRIGQLFAVLMTFNVIVLEPYIARQRREKLARTYLLFLFLAVAGSIPVVLTAFLHPQVFLWVLGAKYANLGAEVGWLVLGSCVVYVAGLIWVMNRARRWLFWSGTVIEIVLLFGLQTAYAVVVGVRTVHQAVLLTCIASFSPLIAHACVGVIGFAKGVRKTSATRAA